MKKDTHPTYQKVLFVDSSTGQKYLLGTTMQPKETEEFDGVEYPACHVAISASSHPYFVGGKQFVDTEGRIDKFRNRYKAVQQKAQQEQEKRDQQEEEQPATKKTAKKKA